MGALEEYVERHADELPLYRRARDAARGRAEVKVEASLLDSGMLYQRAAILHAGASHRGELAGRKALHALLCADEGELVQIPADDGSFADAAASLIVRGAIADGPAPLIITTSPGASPAGLWGLRAPAGRTAAGVWRRWLPPCPGERELGAYRAHAEEGYVRRAVAAVVEATAGYLGRRREGLDLHTARMALRGRLDLVNSARMILLNVVASGARDEAVGLQVDRLAQLCDLGEGEASRLRRSATSLVAIDRALDGVRSLELWLALHVFECAWLEYARGHALLSDEELGQRRYHYLDAYWVQLSALSLVSWRSPEGLAEGFRYLRGSGEAAYVVGKIDLLGVSGAAELDAGPTLPLLGLAKRAVVVGAESRGAGPSLAEVAGRACRWDWDA